METSTIVWIVVAVIVIGAVIAFLVTRSGARRTEAGRAKAAEIREQATEHDRRLREREASAAEAQARSDLARVEAQKRELEAERLAEEAESRAGRAASVRQERDEQLRVADRHDPDVRTDKEGFRVDEHGNRLDEDDLSARGGLDRAGQPYGEPDGERARQDRDV